MGASGLRVLTSLSLLINYYYIYMHHRQIMIGFGVVSFVKLICARIKNFVALMTHTCKATVAVPAVFGRLFLFVLLFDWCRISTSVVIPVTAVS